MRFVIRGQIKSGKNNMKIGRNGRHYPSREWAEWRDGVMVQIMGNRFEYRGGRDPIKEPCKAVFTYFPGDLRRRDVPGMMDAIFHVLERAGVIKDDSLFINVFWETMKLDKQNPRLEVEIHAL